MDKDDEVKLTSDIGGIAAYWNRNHKDSPTKRCPQCRKGTVVTVDRGRLEICVNCDYVTLIKVSKAKSMLSAEGANQLIFYVFCGIFLWFLYKMLL